MELLLRLTSRRQVPNAHRSSTRLANGMAGEPILLLYGDRNRSRRHPMARGHRHPSAPTSNGSTCGPRQNGPATRVHPCQTMASVSLRRRLHPSSLEHGRDQVCTKDCQSHALWHPLYFPSSSHYRPHRRQGPYFDQETRTRRCKINESQGGPRIRRQRACTNLETPGNQKGLHLRRIAST